AGGLIVCAAAGAHDLRVMGGRNVKVGDDVTIFINFAHTDPVDEVGSVKRLENYLLVSPSGSKAPLEKRKGESLHDATMKMEEKGVYQALATTTADVQTKL